MKRLFLGLTSVFMLIAVSCKPDTKPISFRYVAGQLKVGKYSTDTWKYVALGTQSNGQWSEVKGVSPITPDSIVSFNDWTDAQPKNATDYALIGSKKSKEELDKLTEEARDEEVKPVSDTIKGVKRTDKVVGFVATEQTIKIERVKTDNADGTKVQLSTNNSAIDIKNYIVLVDGEEVTFTQDSNDKTKWSGSAKTNVAGKKACIYSRKTDAKYLRTPEIPLS